VAVWKTYVWSGTETTGRTRVALVIVAPLITENVSAQRRAPKL
jgi:hypothetical protein